MNDFTSHRIFKFSCFSIIEDERSNKINKRSLYSLYLHTKTRRIGHLDILIDNKRKYSIFDDVVVADPYLKNWCGKIFDRIC